MIPVLVDGVKKYLLTEEEVDAKISASSGGSSSENPYKQMDYYVFSQEAIYELVNNDVFGDVSSELLVEFASGDIINLGFAMANDMTDYDPHEYPEKRIVRIWLDKSASHTFTFLSQSVSGPFQTSDKTFVLNSVGQIAGSEQSYSGIEWEITNVSVEPE